ncbi:leucine rich repeat protein, putative [Eimeria maxima]|uniref:Leucine rich repeat protein, putative n=1 Tax=Eimeria maxima TaxID=5804 RepID=U6M9H4_EIMMA|nr:leucine rich repeat protein, putative [Eimeria maxima]CDJ60666.1 leucine rich repeat protein, putative [Eimeria maxima]
MSPPPIRPTVVAAAAAAAAAAVAVAGVGSRCVSVPGPPLDLSFRSFRSISEIHKDDDCSNKPTASESSQEATTPSNIETGSVSLASSPRFSVGAPDSLSKGLNVSFLPATPAAAPASGSATAAAPVGAAATGAGGGGTTSFPPTRKSICLSRSTRVVSVCSMAMKDGSGDIQAGDRPASKVCRISRYTTAVRLNNNELQEAPNLRQHLSMLLPMPHVNLVWLDLSFNKLAAVPSSLNELCKIKCIYLHANQIQDPMSVLVLQNNKCLRFLTLFRNPLELQLDTQYRVTILSVLPSLRCLDFTPISSDEVEVACRINAPLTLKRAAKQMQMQMQQQQLLLLQEPPQQQQQQQQQQQKQQQQQQQQQQRQQQQQQKQRTKRQR